ncbi:MAG: peroxiredoxin family protein [Pirellulaceae bacterium]
MSRPSLLWSVLFALAAAQAVLAQQPPPPPAPAAEAKPAEAEKPAEAAAPTGPLPGHSQHGEVFNEGPRQRAYLMAGMPQINFPATTKSPEAQAFINQGVGQLHGFWYYEAERSFRQAALLDKECGIAYWGMAMANIDNASRGKKFMAECLKHKGGITERETMYIDALDAWFKADSKKKKERGEAYTKALEKILYKHPSDVEARAFLALQLWKNRDSGIPISSYLAIDALLDQVFLAEPMHPAHHYRIHLWDYEQAEKALGSAALGGQSSPGIAHMWHMPGHIYSRLKRYDDACWQQEASARVDHAHMMRDRVMPDQIHNFAHNNEWLIRDMVFVGRMQGAIDLAKNMCELPRHPKYNTLTKGSANYGRLRLFEALARFECWDELVAFCDTPYLEATDNENEQVKRLRYLGMAHYRSGNVSLGDAQLADLQQRWAAVKGAHLQVIAEAENKARVEKKSEADIEKARKRGENKNSQRLATLQKAVDELVGHQAVAQGDMKRGHEYLKKSSHAEAGYLARVQFLAGDKDKAIEAARKHAGSRKKEVLPLVALVELLWLAGNKEDAKKSFDELRAISGSIDPTAPLYARLAPIAKELAYPEDWKVAVAPKGDTGVRPSLETLGPFRWQPSPANHWALKDATGQVRSLAEYRGKPVLVLFFLGHGCLHCAEQVQAFGSAAKEFEAAGISLVAISSDDEAGLKQSIDNYKPGAIPIPLVADSTLETFRAYRCYDDFEQQPLHGAFLVDGDGLVRWQDISYQPFMDTKFLLGEARRLLGQSAAGSTPRPTPQPMAAE